MRKKPERPKPSALAKAVELLAGQEHSKRRLTEKLRIRGYEEEEIDGAVERLEERHYLDDEAACARAYQRFYEDGAMSCRQRGFPPALVRASAPQDPDRDEREKKAAVRSLKGKFHGPSQTEKMKQFLYRRGFSYEVCDAAVEAFLEENPEFRMEEKDSYEE